MGKPITIIGAGRIGRAAEHFLREEGEEVRVYDVGEWTSSIFDIGDVFLAACPWDATENIILELKQRNGKIYFDMTEDVEVGAVAREQGPGDSIFVPHCGVAPGAVSIIGGDMLHRGGGQDLHIRVGAIPQRPCNKFGYSLNWSTSGLINEYTRPCPVILDGEVTSVDPLSGVEGVEGRFEAFYTSGGLGTLVETQAGLRRNVTYKTVRWPGHRSMMRRLLKDFGYGRKLGELEAVFDMLLPRGAGDMVFVRVQSDNHRCTKFIYQQGHMSAIQRATAGAAAATIMAVLHNPDLTVRVGGWIANEDIPLKLVEKYKCWTDVYGVNSFA